MQAFFGIAYLVVGLVQFFAVWDGVSYGLNIGSFFAFFKDVCQARAGALPRQWKRMLQGMLCACTPGSGRDFDR